LAKDNKDKSFITVFVQARKRVKENEIYSVDEIPTELKFYDSPDEQKSQIKE
jgi:hypothetical protein